MPKKTADPVEIKLLDAIGKARSAWERGWRRMKRAMHAMEKADAMARRLARRLDAHRENGRTTK